MAHCLRLRAWTSIRSSGPPAPRKTCASLGWTMHKRCDSSKTPFTKNPIKPTHLSQIHHRTEAEIRCELSSRTERLDLLFTGNEQRRRSLPVGLQSRLRAQTNLATERRCDVNANTNSFRHVALWHHVDWVRTI